MNSLWRLAILGVLVGCGGGPLEVPHQVKAAGLGRGARLPQPCPQWCRVSGLAEVRALTDAQGQALAFEVALPSAPWDQVLADTSKKWGGPHTTYRIYPDSKGDPLAWTSATESQHRAALGGLAPLARRGDPRATTDFAVWRSGGTVVQLSGDGTALRAMWFDAAAGGW